ncbi:Endo-type membrane-bound lytic murein transglycosylase A [Serratia symbiotica]|nr:Endo-type membrane-bound lytic murein transglycosylase A [Serratia symbiotica]
MKINTFCMATILLFSGCAKKPQSLSAMLSNSMLWEDEIKTPMQSSVNQRFSPKTYNNDIHKSANYYCVDETLIKAIIQVESGFNPDVVSTSNAVGLMQVKPATAGRDVYRLKGLRGQPSLRELKNPIVNIDLGTAYINIIQNQQLAGIHNPQTLLYATIVAYVNGAGAMLRIFALDKCDAVRRINQMTPGEFFQHIQKNHPAPQATRYLAKVSATYQALLQ